MRHRKKVKKLGRTKAHRKATLQNLARGIIQHQQIKTTLAKAKAARSVVERLITYGKKNTVAARRLAFKVLQNHQMVKKLFDEIAPTFADRQGGYTRVIKLGRRRGDGAELAILQLVGFEPLIIEEKKAPAKKAKKKETTEKKKPAKKAEETKPAEEKVEEVKAEAAEEKPAKEEKAEKKEKAPAKESKKAKKEAEAKPKTEAKPKKTAAKKSAKPKKETGEKKEIAEKKAGKDTEKKETGEEENKENASS